MAWSRTEKLDPSSSRLRDGLMLGSKLVKDFEKNHFEKMGPEKGR